MHSLHPLIRPRPSGFLALPSLLCRCLASAASASATAPSPASAPTGAAVDALFYDPRLRLSHRQRDVFARLDSLPPRAPLQDHGYLYGLTAGDLGSASEAVRRALSTRTSDLEGLRRFKTAQIVQAVGGSAGNSGSSRVQVTLITERIKRLSLHMAKNGHDTACQRTLQVLTSRRRKLLQYMIRTDFQSYRAAIKELELRPLPIVASRHPPKVREETHKKINARNARVKSRAGRGDRGH